MSQTATLAGLRPCAAMLVAVIAFGWYVDRSQQDSPPPAAKQAKAEVMVGAPQRSDDWPPKNCDELTPDAATSSIRESAGLPAASIRAVTDRRGALVVLPRHVTQAPSATLHREEDSIGENPWAAEPSDAAVRHGSRSVLATRLPQVSRLPSPAAGSVGSAVPLMHELHVPRTDLVLNAPTVPAEPLQVDWESLLASPLPDLPQTLDPAGQMESVPLAQQDRDVSAPRDFALPGGGLDIRQLAPTRFVSPLPSTKESPFSSRR